MAKIITVDDVMEMAMGEFVVIERICGKHHTFESFIVDFNVGQRLVLGNCRKEYDMCDSAEELRNDIAYSSYDWDPDKFRLWDGVPTDEEAKTEEGWEDCHNGISEGGKVHGCDSV